MSFSAFASERSTSCRKSSPSAGSIDVAVHDVERIVARRTGAAAPARATCRRRHRRSVRAAARSARAPARSASRTIFCAFFSEPPLMSCSARPPSGRRDALPDRHRRAPRQVRGCRRPCRRRCRRGSWKPETTPSAESRASCAPDSSSIVRPQRRGRGVEECRAVRRVARGRRCEHEDIFGPHRLCTGRGSARARGAPSRPRPRRGVRSSRRAGRGRRAPSRCRSASARASGPRRRRGARSSTRCR